MPQEVREVIVTFRSARRPQWKHPFNLHTALIQASRQQRFAALSFDPDASPENREYRLQQVLILFEYPPFPSEVKVLEEYLQAQVREHGHYSSRGLTPLDAFSGYELTVGQLAS